MGNLIETATSTVHVPGGTAFPFSPVRFHSPRAESPPVDHYADAVFSKPGRCWRMVYEHGDAGRPEHCAEPVEWVGNHHLAGGKRIRVWTCECHLEGVERPERVDHR
jgi:hypothetical protein